ncbi:MAG: Xaa-Pro peptidase family protein [Anaerolineales bacterium]|jgi:Xaa-Pro dipeptidase
MLVNVERLQAKMDEDKLDGIVAATLPNVHYLSGFASLALAGFPYEGQCYAVISRDQVTQPVVVSSTVELDQVLDGTGVKDTIRFGTFYREGPFGSANLNADEVWLKQHSVDSLAVAGPFEGLAAAIEKLGLADKHVGLDEYGLRAGFSEALEEKFPRARFSKAFHMMRWVRKVKSPEEIRRLREVNKIVERAILAATAIAREGITEYELAREFDRSIVSQGARPHFTMIRFARNGVAGQREPSRSPLQKGDTIWFDVGAVYQGYWADIARTFCLGEPGKRAAQIYAALLAGEQIGMERARAGMTGAQLFEITMQATRDAGHPDYRRHHVGHNIGLEVYEAPILAPGNQDVIEAGSVVNIETPYYEFGLGALHVEDPFLVKEDGQHEWLTTLDRNLQIINP